MIPSIDRSFSPFPQMGSLSQSIGELISSKENRLLLEKGIQLALNQGEQVFPQDLYALQAAGYSITYDPETLLRFQSFVLPQDSELTEAIRSATPKGGLLVDCYKTYRPGLASSSRVHGAAKGYDEIFAVFEAQTTEKKRIGKDIRHIFQLVEQYLPKDHSWKSHKTILDLGCGNGVQSQEIYLEGWNLIGLDNQAPSILNCQKLLPDQKFEVYDVFLPAPDHLKQQVNLIFASHLYCNPQNAFRLIQNLKDYTRSDDVLLLFINGDEGTDTDQLCYKLPFLRGKPSTHMSEEFKKALQQEGYNCTENLQESKVLFPQLTPEIRQFLLNIKRGDYTNPYPNIDPNIKIFKALMEFIASFHLEFMTQEQISLYLDTIEKIFEKNGGPFLKICNKILIAHPKKASFPFRQAVEKAQELEVDEYQLERVKDQCEYGAFKEAKEILGKLLRKKREDPSLFVLMADVCLKNNEYPEAATLLWYAKRLGGSLDLQIENVEITLLQKHSSQIGISRGLTQAAIDQQNLRELRERTQHQYHEIQPLPFSIEKAEKLRHLYKNLSFELKRFIEDISQDVVQQLQTWGHPLPCDYALLGLGSLAREEMTPYSDFEFAILIESEKEKDKSYFRLFSQLLHLRFINFGETILPSLDIQPLRWLYDEITPRGLSFDGSMPQACKYPIGKQKGRAGDYELIHTPQEMAQLQKIQASDLNQQIWVLKRYHLPTILANSAFITGSNKGSDLHQQYEEQVHIILLKEGAARSLHLMEDDLNRFKPKLEEQHNGKHYNVKSDLYRLPNTMFDGLASFFSLRSASTWERIEEMENLKIISPEGAKNLKIFTMEAQELRLATYLQHGRQKEHLDLDNHKEDIQQMYYISLAFAKTMEIFCFLLKQGQNPTSSLNDFAFCENTPYHRGLIHLRHMEFLQAEQALEEEKQESIDYLQTYAGLKNILGKYQEAEQTYQKAIEKNPNPELYQELGIVRQELALYPQAEEAFLQALICIHKNHHQFLNFEEFHTPDNVRSFEKITKQYCRTKKSYTEDTFLNSQCQQKENIKKIDKALLQFEKVYLSLTKFYKEIADFPQARSCLKQCKKLADKRTSTLEKDSEYQVIIDLDLAELKMVEADLVSDLDSQFDQQRKLMKGAMQIFIGYYRREDHPKVFHCEEILNI